MKISILFISLLLMFACQTLPKFTDTKSIKAEVLGKTNPILYKQIITKNGIKQDTIPLLNKTIGLAKNYSLIKGDTLFIPFESTNTSKENINPTIIIKKGIEVKTNKDILMDPSKGYLLDDGIRITIDDILIDFPELKTNSTISIMVKYLDNAQAFRDLNFIYKVVNSPIILIKGENGDNGIIRDTIYDNKFAQGKGKSFSDNDSIIIPFSKDEAKLSISISSDRQGSEKEGYKILQDIDPNPFLVDKNFIITSEIIKNGLDIPPFHYIRIKVTGDAGDDRDYMFKYIDNWSYLGISAPVFLKLDGKPGDLSIEKFLPGIAVRWLQRNFDNNKFQYINTGFLFSLIPKSDKPTYSFVFGADIDLGGWLQLGYIHHFGDSRGYWLIGLRPDMFLKLIPTLFN